MNQKHQFSIAEAKNRLPAIVHFVEKGSYVQLTRRGKPVAVLLSMQEYESLIRKKIGFGAALAEFRRQHMDEGIEISDRDFEGIRDNSTGREVQFDR